MIKSLNFFATTLIQYFQQWSDLKKFKWSCEFLNYIVVSSFILFLVIINKVSLILFNSKPNGGTIIILTVKRQSLEYLRRVNGFKKCNHENNNYFLNSTYQQNLRMTSLIIEATLGKLNWIENIYCQSDFFLTCWKHIGWTRTLYREMVKDGKLRFWRSFSINMIQGS